MPPEKLHFCPNGLDIARFFPQSRRGSSPSQGSSITVGIVCLLRPEKNIELLLGAFAKVQHRFPESQLVIVGSGPELNRLLKLRSDLNLSEPRCLFVPATKDVATWPRRIDIFVLPSRSEASANALLEAMASGCCVIASSAGGNLDLIEHKRTGLLFPSGDLERLCVCLETTLFDKGLRKRLGENAAALVRASYSWENSAHTMQEIYLKLLNRGGSPLILWVEASARKSS